MKETLLLIQDLMKLQQAAIAIENKLPYAKNPRTHADLVAEQVLITNAIEEGVRLLKLHSREQSTAVHSRKSDSAKALLCEISLHDIAKWEFLSNDMSSYEMVTHID